MPLGDSVRIRTIAAAKRRRERKPPLPGSVHDGAVARDQALVTKAESAEFILAMRVDAGLIEDQTRSRPIDHGGKMFS